MKTNQEKHLAQNQQPATSSCMLSEVESCFQQGLSYLKSARFQEAIEMFRKAADRGHTASQYEAGKLLLMHKKSHPEALVYLRQAASKNCPQAHYQLSFCAQKGLAMPQDEVSACKSLQLAFESGYSPPGDAAKRHISLVDMGKAAADSKLYKLALDYFLQALKIEPLYEPAFVNIILTNKARDSVEGWRYFLDEHLSNHQLLFSEGHLIFQDPIMLTELYSMIDFIRQRKNIERAALYASIVLRQINHKDFTNTLTGPITSLTSLPSLLAKARDATNKQGPCLAAYFYEYALRKDPENKEIRREFQQILTNKFFVKGNFLMEMGRRALINGNYVAARIYCEQNKAPKDQAFSICIILASEPKPENLESAKKSLLKAIDLEKNPERLSNLLCYCLANIQRVAALPNEHLYWSALAKVAFDKRYFDVARWLYHTALKKEGDFPEAYFHMGQCFQHLNLTEFAAQAYLTAWKINPSLKVTNFSFIKWLWGVKEYPILEKIMQSFQEKAALESYLKRHAGKKAWAKEVLDWLHQHNLLQSTVQAKPQEIEAEILEIPTPILSKEPKSGIAKKAKPPFDWVKKINACEDLDSFRTLIEKLVKATTIPEEVTPAIVDYFTRADETTQDMILNLNLLSNVHLVSIKAALEIKFARMKTLARENSLREAPENEQISEQPTADALGEEQTQSALDQSEPLTKNESEAQPQNHSQTPQISLETAPDPAHNLREAPENEQISEQPTADALGAEQTQSALDKSEPLTQNESEAQPQNHSQTPQISLETAPDPAHKKNYKSGSKDDCSLTKPAYSGYRKRANSLFFMPASKEGMSLLPQKIEESDAHLFRQLWDKRKKNDAEALLALGKSYHHGRNGVKQSFGQAVYYYRKAFEQGFAADAEALFALGESHYYGINNVQDFKQAVYYYEEAANLGFAAAEYSLGICYLLGYGLTRNTVTAFIYLKSAAEKQFHFAYSSLAQLYLSKIGSANEQKGLYWMQEAAKHNDPYALNYFANLTFWSAEFQFNLGEHHYFGINGVEQNFTQAAYYYENAASQDFAPACYRLGICYLLGRGVSKNLLTAFTYIKQAAEDHYTLAQKTLGYLTINDDEVVAKLDESEFSLEKLAPEGDNEALEYLANLESPTISMN